MTDDFFSDEELTSIKKVTLEEFGELTERLHRLTAKPELLSEDIGALGEIGKIFHTIRGSAALAGFKRISRLGADMEALISKVTAGSPVSQDTTNRVNSAIKKVDVFLKTETARLP
jgi:chemotaxis protein histidine kinase CheA